MKIEEIVRREVTDTDGSVNSYALSQFLVKHLKLKPSDVVEGGANE